MGTEPMLKPTAKLRNIQQPANSSKENISTEDDQQS